MYRNTSNGWIKVAPVYTKQLGIYMLDRMFLECLISMEDFEVMFAILININTTEGELNHE